jgi:hypothetical protein
MANATVLNFGQINTAGAVDAIFLKVFGGEVMAIFNRALATEGKVYSRSISSGKSAQFPLTGDVTVGYHTAGTEIVGQATDAAEKVITIDDMIYGSVFFDKLSEAKSHYEVRAPYSERLGNKLAVLMDKNNLRAMILSARSSAISNDHNGGT